MKKALWVSLMVLLVLVPALATKAQAEPYNIGVFFWHESSNDYMAFEGIKQGFKIARVDCEFDIQKALGDERKAEQIIQAWAKQKPDLIYAMGTGAAERLMKVIEDTPIVFTAVTNPVLSGIVPNWETSGRNIAGNSNWIPTVRILENFQAVVPTMKTLGVMYDPDNTVSSVEVKSASKVIRPLLGMKLITAEVKEVGELATAAKKMLTQKVDAIWVPIDILVYKNLDKVRAVIDPAGIPLLASSHRGVKDGAIFGMIVDYPNLGKKSVPLALEILTRNVAPKDIPIDTMRSHLRIVNPKVAESIGYKIPLKV
jgi:putative ABC transport system substrate-binding protein